MAVMQLGALRAHAVVVTFLLLAACKSAPPDAKAPTTTIPTSSMLVDTATVTSPRSFTGQVYVEHDVAVAARAAGMIDSLSVQLGSEVRSDAVMASIEHRAQEIELARAQVVVDRARNARLRSRALSPSGGVAVADSERVEEDLREAELALLKARREMDLTRVVAPFSGRVMARYVRPRQLVAVGDTLFRVVETSPLLVRVRVDDATATSVRIGDRATIVAANGVTRDQARVLFTAPALDAASGTREVILRLDGVRFLSGQSVTAEMGSERRHVLVAPRAGLSPEGFALVVDDARTTLRPVVLGVAVDGDRVEIVSGLSAGERLAPPRR